MFWMRRTDRRLLVLAVLFELQSTAKSSLAEQPSDDGRRLFQVGVQAYERGQYAPAIAAFREAYRLTARPGLLFSLAQSFRRAYENSRESQDLSAAIEHYTRYLATQPSGERKLEAERYLEQLQSSVAKSRPEEHAAAAETTRTALVLDANVPGARSSLDGAPPEPLPRTAAVLPGRHTLEISADGYGLFRKEIEIRLGEVVALRAQLVRSAGLLSITGNSGAEAFVDGRSLGALPISTVSIPYGSHAVEVRQAGHYSLRRQIDLSSTGSLRLHLAAPQTPKRIVAWALVASGVTGVAVGTVLGYVARRNDREAQRLERDEPDNYLDFNRAVGRRDDYRLAAAIVAGTGAASALAGGILILTDEPGPVRRVARTRLSPAVSFTPQAVHLALHGSF
jgi:hypothetical protein